MCLSNKVCHFLDKYFTLLTLFYRKIFPALHYFQLRHLALLSLEDIHS